MISIGSGRLPSSIRLNSAGASLRPARSPVAPKMTTAVGSGLRFLAATSPRISAVTDDEDRLGGEVGLFLRSVISVAPWSSQQCARRLARPRAARERLAATG